MCWVSFEYLQIGQKAVLHIASYTLNQTLYLVPSFFITFAKGVMFVVVLVCVLSLRL